MKKARPHARQPARATPEVIDDDPAGLVALTRAYLDYARASRFSESTARMREWHLRWFVSWCKDRDVTRAVDVTRALCERYQRWLFHARKDDGKPLGARYQHDRLTAVRGFFRWAVKKNHVLYNPAGELELRRLPKRLPRAVLTHVEVERIMILPDLSAPSGLRDRAMLETFYSSGVRRFELARLELRDVDTERGSVLVREGKGRKDRFVPLGERACAFVRKYLDEGRSFLSVDDDVVALFLRDDGAPFVPRQLTELVSRYVKASGVDKVGSCHMLRHAMATAMLDGGADIRFIQAMLGHAELSTTEIYTHVAISKLKEVHAATHPSASLAGNQAARAELLRTLAAEADDDDADDDDDDDDDDDSHP